MMGAAARQQVRQRAGGRNEFCRLPQEQSAPAFHIDHIITPQHGGSDDLENLAGRTTVWLLEVNTGDRFIWRESLMRLGLGIERQNSRSANLTR